MSFLAAIFHPAISHEDLLPLDPPEDYIDWITRGDTVYVNGEFPGIVLATNAGEQEALVRYFDTDVSMVAVYWFHISRLFLEAQS